MLREGERFLDVGAGWGGLLLWAAERYGVRAHGITLSKNQHAHVNRLIAERGLAGRVTMELRDYRDLPEDEPYDKIASIGMFEHVGHVMLPAYFAKIWRLLAPGGLLPNHGITAGGRATSSSGAGMGDFIERHLPRRRTAAHVTRARSSARRAQALDVENLRPHYARTLWGWSDGLGRGSGMPARSPANPSYAPIGSHRRQRDVLRAWLDLAVPDARVAAQRPHRGRRHARCTIWLSVPTRLHIPLSQGPCSGSSPRRPETSSCSPRPATRCCASSAASPRQGHPRSRRHARRAGRAFGAAVQESEQARRDAEAEAAAEAAFCHRASRSRCASASGPLAEMIRRAHAAKADIVWGV